jgi:hypothetical protein
VGPAQGDEPIRRRYSYLALAVVCLSNRLGDGLPSHAEFEWDEGRGKPALAQIDQRLEFVVISAAEQLGTQSDKLAV